jgi:serine/threonine protein kinase
MDRAWWPAAVPTTPTLRDRSPGVGYGPPVSETRDAVTPAAERLVGERYRLGPVLGRGGMATVHRATDIRLDRDVAVKLLRPEVMQDRDLAQRFRREALAATVLRHPNIVACLDTGTDEGQPYLVMELVDGEDLAARLRRGGRLSPAQVARIGLDVARGLGVAHVRGIVHRDVKPGNILLAADGRAMVTDFGIARLAMDAEASMPGTTLGSVHYFSPEQARGATTTPASDVYGLGLVLYEALTGSRAWSGDSTDAIALARVGATAPSVLAARPDVPDALAAIVARALDPDQERRYPNGTAMASALEPLLTAGERPPTASSAHAPSRISVSGDPGSPPPQAAAPGAASIRPPGRQLSLGLGAMGLAIGAIGLALAVLALAPDGSDVVAATEAPGATGGVQTERPEPVTPEPLVTPEPEPTPTATPEPTDAPTPLPQGTVADLCETFFDLPCGMGAGVYSPSRFSPPLAFEIGDGWSTQAHGADIVVLARDEGFLTFMARVVAVGDIVTDAVDRPRSLIEALVTMDGVGARPPAEVRIGGAEGWSVDLSPLGSQRTSMLGTGENTYYLEADRTTRVVALEVDGEVVVLIIEPSDEHDLRAILDTADPVAGTISWR